MKYLNICAHTHTHSIVLPYVQGALSGVSAHEEDCPPYEDYLWIAGAQGQ